MSNTRTREGAALDLSLLIAASAFAWIVLGLEGLAARSKTWEFLIYLDLGLFSGLANFFIQYLLPGIPFVFAARRALRSAKNTADPIGLVSAQ